MDSETGQGFIRQRRNLISISLILFFYQVLGVKIDTLNIFGTTVKIENSFHIALILWITCLYFLLRYYQYYKHIDIGEVTNGIKLRMKKPIDKIAFEIFKQTYDPLKTTSVIPPPHEIKFSHSENGNISTEEWKLDLYVEISGILSSGARQSNIMGFSVVVNQKKLIWAKLKAWINLAFTTRFVTEYYLPFLLAYIPIVYQIYQWTYIILINLK